MTLINKKFESDLKSWPFIEAFKIINKFGGLNNFNINKKNHILFETGYGPSGLPHIGTFGEVVRTSMVRHALKSLVNCNTKLVIFSDDMDGLRKVPDNVPNQDMLKKYIGKPLTSIPDPFKKFESFGHHNNAKLKSFLDQFKFEYEFLSSSANYKSGKFNDTIKIIFNNIEKINSIIIPTLRSERQKTYSPFLPISPINGEVLEVKIDEYKADSETIVFKDPANNKSVEVGIYDGNCKLQWKVDWAMRWISLGVDYEMCGKDLTESYELASKICLQIDKKPPINLIYEMFLDEKGEKISKSRGNGISVDDWLRYAPAESLSLFMYQKPKSAKKLFFDVIPKSTDEYLTFIKKSKSQSIPELYNNPAWHIHEGNSKKIESEISFNLIMNLVGICNSTEKKTIKGFLKEYKNNLDFEDSTFLDSLIQNAINYYIDFILPKKEYLKVNKDNKIVFSDMLELLENIDKESSSEQIQTEIYEIGKKHDFKNLKDFFYLIYRVLLGQEQGPRLGSFVRLYGIENTCELLKKIIKGEDLFK